MSLIKQLWIAVVIIMVLSLGGSIVVSTISARTYLQEQLFLKNLDNVTSLALSMSQVAKDQVTLELLLTAQFDSGHYQFIRLTDPSGAVILERQNPPAAANSPAWFARLVPLSVPPAAAQVQDGWKQIGTLTLRSHDRFAYEALWRETLELFLWFAAVAVTTGFIGSLMLRSVNRPLHEMVNQAEAIGARRFITIAEPRTHELRRVVKAMNALSIRVKAMLEEESARLEEMRRASQHDSLTGLLNREEFLKRVNSIAARDDASAVGMLIIARFSSLADINRELGRETADQLLRRLGERLAAMAETHPEWCAGRLNGADFALLGVGVSDPALAEEVAGALHLAIDDVGLGEERMLPVGATFYGPGENLSQLLSRVDGALAAAERAGGLMVHVFDRTGYPQPMADLASWRAALSFALQSGGLKLATYPVVDKNGSLLHLESPVRLLVGGEWHAAGAVIPWAGRLGLMPRLDTLVLAAALDIIAERGVPVGINVSPEALCDAEFRDEVRSRLLRAPTLAPQLWLEVPEVGAFRHLADFRSFCLALKSLGCKIGLEHVGHRFFRIVDVHDLGIDYIKIDTSIIRDVDIHPGSQAFVRGLCMIAHSIGLIVIAEGVQGEGEMHILPRLGVDGMTGPGVRDPSSPGG